MGNFGLMMALEADRMADEAESKCPSCGQTKNNPVRPDRREGATFFPSQRCYDKFHEPESDMVNHPPHYKSATGVECIIAIQAALTPEEFVGFLKGQVLKYTWRMGKKGSAAEDAKKAAWYNDRLVNVLEAKP